MSENKDKSGQSDTRLIQIQIIDAQPGDIPVIREALSELKEKLPFKLEGIITSDKIQLRDLDFLLKEFYELKKSLIEKSVTETGVLMPNIFSDKSL